MELQPGKLCPHLGFQPPVDLRLTQVQLYTLSIVYCNKS